jgi:hypothetical protein
MIQSKARWEEHAYVAVITLIVIHFIYRQVFFGYSQGICMMHNHACMQTVNYVSTGHGAGTLGRSIIAHRQKRNEFC